VRAQGSESDFGMDEDSPVPKKKAAPKGKAALADKTNTKAAKPSAKAAASSSSGAAAASKGRKGKTIEQIYQKKTQLEHILLRPDTYGTSHRCVEMRQRS
jgi:hypothetical protein